MRASTSARPSRTAERASPVSSPRTPAVASATAAVNELPRRCSAVLTLASTVCSRPVRVAASDWSRDAVSPSVNSARNWALRSSAAVPMRVSAVVSRSVIRPSSSPRRSSKRLSRTGTTTPSPVHLALLDLRQDVAHADEVALAVGEVLAQAAQLGHVALEGADVDGRPGHVGQCGAEALQFGDLGGRGPLGALHVADHAAQVVDRRHLAPQVDDVLGPLEVGRHGAVDARLLVFEHHPDPADLVEQTVDLHPDPGAADRRRESPAPAAAGHGRAQFGVEPLGRHLGQVAVVGGGVAEVERAARGLVLGRRHLEGAAHRVDQGVPVVGVDGHPGALGPEPRQLVEQGGDPRLLRRHVSPRPGTRRDRRRRACGRSSGGTGSPRRTTSPAGSAAGRWSEPGPRRRARWSARA